MADYINQIKVENTLHDIRASGIPFGEVASTSTATAFTATVPGVNELKDGVCMLLRNGVVTSASGFTININGLGAKPSYSNMATGNDSTPTAPVRETTIFNINYTMLFIYSESLVSGGCWICYRGYDANSNSIGYQVRTNSMRLPVSDQTGRYRLLFTSADHTHFVPANTSSATSATSAKTVNQRPIDPFGSIRYYGYTTVLSAGTNVGAGYLWQQYVVTMGYSFSDGSVSMTAWHPVYLKCAPQVNGSAIIDATDPYVQTLPTTDDGKIYIYLGVAYAATTFELTLDHPIYYYKDGAIRVWTNAGSALPSSAQNGQVLRYNGSSWSADWQDKSLQLPYQLIPISYDGTDFSTTLTPQDIAEGYTIGNKEYPPYNRAGWTKADLLGNSVLLTPLIGSSDGYEFESSIFDLTPFGFSDQVGLLRIETSGGYTQPYGVVLVTWPSEPPTITDLMPSTAIGNSSTPIYWTGSQFSTATELFECEYGVTTYAAITQALVAGKIPYVEYSGHIYVLSYAYDYESEYSTYPYSFSVVQGAWSSHIEVDSADTWSVSNSDLAEHNYQQIYWVATDQTWNRIYQVIFNQYCLALYADTTHNVVCYMKYLDSSYTMHFVGEDASNYYEITLAHDDTWSSVVVTAKPTSGSSFIIAEGTATAATVMKP